MTPKISLRASSLVLLLAVFFMCPPAWAQDADEPQAPVSQPDDGMESSADTDEQDGDPEWSVADAPGYTETISIDTEEVTWADVSVNPDGSDFLFDMLGDIYRVPIGGGEAVALTRGIAWNFQPRYSPDGATIAFISDRSGADNLWLMDADGSNPRQVSDEREHIVHTPNWSPDGQWLAARKSFVSTRSIAAGEIWLFHVGGGKGVQLVERPLGARDQKNIAEPAFTPDGDAIYYSQDMWPGDTWQYNKDPNKGIFAIHRLDLDDGHTETIVSGPGGAVRPTPSPDGRYLAYVTRRPGLQSALMLMDLESGKRVSLYDQFERDLQSTNGSHGNANAVSWTADSQSILFWSGGGFHRVDVDNKQVSSIPVRVQVEKPARPALRYAVDVAPDRFEVKMLRWAQFTPDRKQVVFEALGRIWVRDADGGAPSPLTRAEGRREAYPVVSPDGASVAFVTWHDEDLGSVRVVSLNGRNERTITREPGHYVEPAFSPDGNLLTWRKITGGYLTSPLWSMAPGLYVAELDGGAPRRVINKGTQPHFGGDAERLFFLVPSGELQNELELHSVTLDGRDERTHLHGKLATMMRVSPDGRWVAWTQDFNGFVAPFAPSPKKVSVDRDDTALPLRQVSARAGDFVTWSADSSALTWSQGPVLYERELSDAFAFLDGAPEELPEPVQTGVDLGFSEPLDRPDGMIALVGGRVVTMRNANEQQEVIDDGVVLVEDNRIVAVGSRGEVDVPSGAHVVDVAGKTVLPGLVDPHAHGSMGNSELIPQQNWMQLSNLSFGVTTIHDPSNDTSEVFAAAELQKDGQLLAPRIFSTGTILYGAHYPGYTARIEDFDEALFHVQRMKDAGAISVKSYNQPRRDQRQQVIEAASRLDMMVFPEGGAKFEHNMGMVLDGHTGIEHALPIAHIYDDVIQFWSQTAVGYTPTFGVAYGGLSGETYWYDRTNVWENERLDAFTPDYIVTPASLRRPTAPDSEYNHVAVAAHAKQLRDQGVTVHIGAHGQREGLAAHWEMWMLEQGGFTPWEAWRAASIDGARYMGMDGDIGSLEPGKLADLVVVDGDPLADIRQSENISHTMLNGRLYDAATMNQLWPAEVERGPLFFELEGGDAWQPATMEGVERKARQHGWRHDH